MTHFLDEYRLISGLCRVYRPALALWDSSVKYGSWCSPGLTFEAPSSICDRAVGLHVRKHGTYHTLPFRENLSKGIAAFAVDSSEGDLTTRRTFVVPAEAFASLAPNIGRTECIPWRDWKHLTSPIEGGLHPLWTCVSHSQVLSIHSARRSLDSTSVLRIYDFSLRSRRKAQCQPSAPLPPYTVQEIPLDANYYHSLFEFTEGGILVSPVRSTRW